LGKSTPSICVVVYDAWLLVSMAFRDT
jgi:hypothetical protein